MSIEPRTKDSAIRLRFDGVLGNPMPPRVPPYSYADIEPLNILIYVGSDASVSEDPEHHSFMIYGRSSVDSLGFRANYTMQSTAEFLKNSKGGKTLYAIAYPGVYRTGYMDPITDLPIYAGPPLPGSPVASASPW